MTLILRPQPDDVMGDHWGSKLHDVWRRMKEVDPDLTSKPYANALWQWAMCKLSGMESRIVASPKALAIAASANNDPQPDTDLIDPLLELSDRVLKEMFG